MPQMAPMNWLILFSFFWGCLVTFYCKVYWDE
uniref:ATP synthase complex subunit 8 n=1 Tax=Tigriopus kingsejongensis TaxID=1133412 RepID=A0A650DDT5_9MAXI|nr:ATP synthase F0 subunit 8 [Tigriopus kingsejongensis]